MDPEQASQSVIASDVQITGTITTSGSLRIDGTLEGDLKCDGDATIGKSAKIKGNLDVNSVSIAGQLDGNVMAKDRIEMKASAKVSGDIRAKRLAVEDGVTFVGRSEVNPSGTGVSPKPVVPAKAPSGQPSADKNPNFVKK